MSTQIQKSNQVFQNVKNAWITLFLLTHESFYEDKVSVGILCMLVKI